MKASATMPVTHRRVSSVGKTQVSRVRSRAVQTAPVATTTSVAYDIHGDVDKILFEEEKIKQRISVLGKQLAAEYADKTPIVLGILKGSFVFTSDLVRAMVPCPKGLTLNFLRASSYGSATKSSGHVKLTVDINLDDIKGRNIILMEDIVETGLTISTVKKALLVSGAKTVKVCTLLNKNNNRVSRYEPDYVGFECPDEFVVGYGLDYEDQYRSLPYVGVLKPSLVNIPEFAS